MPARKQRISRGASRHRVDATYCFAMTLAGRSMAVTMRGESRMPALPGIYIRQMTRLASYADITPGTASLILTMAADDFYRALMI